MANIIRKKEGWLIGGMCKCNSMCKVRPIKQYLRQFATEFEIIQYIGIAIDETKRLERLRGGEISLLAKYGYTEEMAMQKCKQYDLVSPIYTTGTRGGCWFCPNAKKSFFAELKIKHPNLWSELKKLANTPNLISNGFMYGKSFFQVEKEIDIINYNKQRQQELWKQTN